MPTPRIMAVHVPGPNHEPDNDIQSDDSVMIVPFSLVKQALEVTKASEKKVYVFFDKNEWRVEGEDANEVDLFDKKKTLCFENGELISHQYFATI